MEHVNRVEFINLLETTTPGLATKNTFEQSSCFVFTEGWLYTFNGEISCCVKSSLPNLTGAVEAAPLLKTLGLFADDDVGIEVRGSELRIRGNKRAAGVRMQAEVLLPLDQVENPRGWRDLPEDFSGAVEIVNQTAGTKADEFMTLVVHMHPKYLESNDRFQATRYKIQCGHETAFLVRAAALKHVVRFGMHRMSETDNWVHFRNKQGLIFSCRRFAEEYPNLGDLFAIRGEPAVLPRGANAAADLAAVFSGEDRDNDRVVVELSPGRMRIRGEGSHGWARQDLELAGYTGEPCSFRIAPGLLKIIVERYNECEINAREGKLRAFGERFTYISALGKMDDADDADDAPPEPRAEQAQYAAADAAAGSGNPF